jgi:hypothetical protein
MPQAEPAIAHPNREALDEQLSQRFIALDPAGYFLIKVDAPAAELVVEHYLEALEDNGYCH